MKQILGKELVFLLDCSLMRANWALELSFRPNSQLNTHTFVILVLHNFQMNAISHLYYCKTRASYIDIILRKTIQFFLKAWHTHSIDRFRFLSDNLQRESASITSHASFTLHRCLEGRNL